MEKQCFACHFKKWYAIYRACLLASAAHALGLQLSIILGNEQSTQIIEYNRLIVAALVIRYTQV